MTSFPTTIGICGRARVGKNTASAVLCKEFNYERAAFADPLKKCVAAVFAPGHETITDEMKNMMSPIVPYTYGQLLQMVGKLYRDAFGGDVWINVLLHQLPVGSESIVIEDTRYVNEANALRKRGSFILKIERPGVVLSDGRDPNLENEVDVIQGDATVVNDASIESFEEKIRGLFR